jgi:hypothetical protein
VMGGSRTAHEACLELWICTPFEYSDKSLYISS